MLYQNFYRENINWIGFATEQDVNNVDFPIFSGLFCLGLQNPADFEKAIRIAKKKGEKGISIFTAGNLNENQINVLLKLKYEFNME